MRLDFSKPAARDLEDIIQYISLDSPSAAQAVYRAIVAATDRLREFPNSGRPGLLPQTRELPVTSLPYVIVYGVGADAVTVFAIFHGARDLARALAERLNDPGEGT